MIFDLNRGKRFIMGVGKQVTNRFRLFKRDTLILFFAIRHRETPVVPKALALITIVYLVSPFDAVPDFIPFFGLLDDLIVTPFLVGAAVKLLPATVLQESELKARRHGRRLQFVFFLVIAVLIALLVFLVLAGWKLIGELF